ncbi:MAG: hypothetical protein WBP93_01145 [Pyrinomonadaceae bacterium]
MARIITLSTPHARKIFSHLRQPYEEVESNGDHTRLPRTIARQCDDTPGQTVETIRTSGDSVGTVNDSTGTFDDALGT